eukprot:COSAG01_NODE_6024_length_3895_cov_4.417808_4_plen_84_part_00
MYIAMSKKPQEPAIMNRYDGDHSCLFLRRRQAAQSHRQLVPNTIKRAQWCWTRTVNTAQDRALECARASAWIAHSPRRTDGKT